MLKRSALLALSAVAMLGLGGCMGVASPVVGLVYTDAKFGNTVTRATAATKEGRACAQSYFALFATGDASIAAAKAAGGITEVSAVDHTSRNILGVFGEFCTIVRGR